MSYALGELGRDSYADATWVGFEASSVTAFVARKRIGRIAKSICPELPPPFTAMEGKRVV